MALTNKQKQAAFRARGEDAGLKEMRGVWVTDTEETEVKKKIREILKRMRKGN